MTTSNTSETVRFQTGTTYYSRSIGDYNCIFRYTVVRRTEKSVWITPGGSRVSRRSIKTYDGGLVETFMDGSAYVSAEDKMPVGGVRELIGY